MPCSRWSATPAPSSAARTRRRRWATTSPGPNHVLPTYGSARFSGALRVDDFLKHVHVVSFDQAALHAVGEHVIALATYEGLDAHAESIRLRERPA